MNNREIAEFIINTSKNISIKELNNEMRINMGLDACKKIDIIGDEDKTLLISHIYLIYRGLGSLYFEVNQYANSEKFFEMSLQIKEKYPTIDSFVNECITKQMLAREKIMIYLNTNNEKKLTEAQTLIGYIYKFYNKNWNDQFKKNLIETKAILDAVLNDDLKTVIVVEIPYHLLIKDKKVFQFEYDNSICTIESETIRSKSSELFVGDNIYTEKDKYGIVNHSIIKITIGKYVNGNELVKTNRSGIEVFKPLYEGIKVYNFFLKKYIVATQRYWLSELNENMIFNYQISAYAGDVCIKNIPLSISMAVSSSGSLKPSLSESEISKITEELKESDDEIWKLSKNRAKDYFLIQDYKNAIVMINIALENFSYYFAKKKLKKYLTDEQLSSFLEGNTTYDTYFLRDYISEKDFISAKKKGIIKDSPPTIYKIFSKCYEYEDLAITKTQLSKQISIIKKRRNEIVHGYEIKEDLQYISAKSIDTFELMITQLNDI